MSTSVNTIKRLLWILIVVLILTYLISLNLENHYIALNAKWISNEFLFAIAGGAFASLLIVLICELIKYRQLKYATEGALFSYMGNLYGQILILKGNCTRTLNNHDIVPDNLIQSTCDNAMMLADYISGIDYTLFRGNNNVCDILSKFRTEKSLFLKNVLIGFTYLRIAIHEDSKMLLQQDKRDLVTSDCSSTNKVLTKVVNQSTIILTYLDQIITRIDNELGYKYQWHNKKQQLNTYQDNYIVKQLDDYLKEDFVVF